MDSTISNNYQKLLSSGFARDYLITMRPYLLFVSGATGLCGISFTEDLPVTSSLLIFLASFLSYGFGQALTDCFQTDTDSISSPYRPLIRGTISKSQVLYTSIAGLAFCISIFTIYNPVNLLLGIISGTGLATYTYFKRKFWSGPFYNSWIVGVLFLMAFLCGSEMHMIAESTELLFCISAVFWGYANFVIIGYFKDVEADRATGYNTLPVCGGRKAASIAANISGVLTIISVISVFLHSDSLNVLLDNQLPSVIILAAGIIAMLLSQILVHFIRKDDQSGPAVSLSVHAYILLLCSVSILNKSQWLIPVIIFYLLFNLTMLLRPSKNQI